MREKLLILSAPLLAKEGDLCYTKGNLAALLHQALKDKKDVLDSVDGGAAMGGRTVQSRIYPSEGMTGLGPRSSPGSGGPSATSVGVARATAAGGRESLIYLSRQIEQAREMMPYQHRHILFGSQTGEKAEENKEKWRTSLSTSITHLSLHVI